jgi:enamine deaminase RidA (YjgF/YER057c/UK114 family)
MLFASGLGSVDSETGEVIGGDIASQTRYALENLTHLPMRPTISIAT